LSQINSQFKTDYGEIESYLCQDFDYWKCYNENEWLLRSPRLNVKNRNRIISTWEKLITSFKKHKTKEQPCVPAKNFENGFVMFGGDAKSNPKLKTKTNLKLNRNLSLKNRIKV